LDKAVTSCHVMPTTNTLIIRAVTADEIERAVTEGHKADYNDTGILIKLRTYTTNKGEGFSYEITFPNKLTGRTGAPLRLSAKSPTLAIKKIEDKLSERKVSQITDRHKADLISALPDLKELGVSITELVRFYKDNYIGKSKRMTLSELQADLMDMLHGRDAGELRDRTLVQNKQLGERIVKDFKDCEVHKITAGIFYQWIMNAETKDKRWTGKTRKHYRDWFQRLMRYAVSEGAIVSNPLDRLSEEKRRRITLHEKEETKILTKKETEQLLATIRSTRPDSLCMAVLQLFAGLREAEARKITWKQIDLTTDTITVSKEIAKTRQTRFVEINATCKAWLLVCEHFGDEGDLIHPWTEAQAVKRWNIVRKNLPYTWKHNAMRHSYASYTLMLKDEVYTKKQIGHSRDSDTLYTNYREAVTKAQATGYFKLMPPPEMKSVAAFNNKEAVASSS
jgi:integrase